MNSDSQKRITPSDDMEVDEQNIEYEESGLRVDDEIYIPPPLRTFSEADTTGPRLMITKIINENFKSYAGTITIGPFHKVNFNITYLYYYLVILNAMFKLIFSCRVSQQ